MSRFDCAKFSEQCESCDATSVHLNRWLKKGSFAHAQHKVRGRKKEVTYGRCRVQATHVARKCTPCQATCWQFEVPVSRRSLESDNHLSLSFLQSCPASLLLSSLVHSALVVSPPPAPFNIPKTMQQAIRCDRFFICTILEYICVPRAKSALFSFLVLRLHRCGTAGTLQRCSAAALKQAKDEKHTRRNTCLLLDLKPAPGHASQGVGQLEELRESREMERYRGGLDRAYKAEWPSLRAKARHYRFVILDCLLFAYAYFMIRSYGVLCSVDVLECCL